ncbi:MAG: response regulator [Acidobacteriota bacterium]|jgi:putative two-component system response regulator
MDNGERARILIVDDESYIGDLLVRWLAAEGHHCEAVLSGEDALDRLSEDTFDVLLLDIQMPGMSGVDVLARAKREHPDLVVVMVTGVDDRAIGDRCMELGAHSYILKPFGEQEVLLNVAGALHEHNRALEQLDERQRLEDEVRRRTEQIRRREEEIALRLVSAAEYRDEESGGHIRRIGMYAEALARALGWDRYDIDDIRVAATMHDIGKIGVPDGILLKSGRLTPQEFEVVKLHAEIGAQLLQGSDIPLLHMAEQIARSHHERWDGSGYPQGLAGDAIPLSARMVAVADVFDSLTCQRVYRPPYSESEALGILREGRGKIFDPEVFDVFMDVLPAFRHIKEKVSDEHS